MSETPHETTAPASEGWQTTSTNPRWIVKFMIFFVVCAGLGVWGAYDAFVAYPARGQFDAEWKLRLYLEQADQSRRIFGASVADPAAELEALRAKPAGERTTLEETKLDWLESLALVESLASITATNSQNDVVTKDQNGEPFEDTKTYFDDPADVLSTLKAEHSTKSAPKPLSSFDIPVQYLIMIVGLGAGAWILLNMLRKMRVKYRYDASRMALELADGRVVTPDMIEDVDKRQWHKFFVTLHLADGSKAAKLDLYIHVPLEEWVLEMEPHTPNYEPEEDEAEPDGDGEADAEREADSDEDPPAERNA